MDFSSAFYLQNENTKIELYTNAKTNKCVCVGTINPGPLNEKGIVEIEIHSELHSIFHDPELENTSYEEQARAIVSLLSIPRSLKTNFSNISIRVHPDYHHKEDNLLSISLMEYIVSFFKRSNMTKIISNLGGSFDSRIEEVEIVFKDNFKAVGKIHSGSDESTGTFISLTSGVDPTQQKELVVKANTDIVGNMFRALIENTFNTHLTVPFLLDDEHQTHLKGKLAQIFIEHTLPPENPKKTGF